MFHSGDGTGRAPRPSQQHIFKWLESTLKNRTRVKAINAPPGIGKSYILRALQLEYPGAVGIAPSNNLMDQYIATYPDLNYIKGKEHYPCSECEGYSCQEAQDLFGSKCLNCLITQQRLNSLNGESTVFNPISYYYFRRAFKAPAPRVLIVDEAHKFKASMELLVDFSFRKSKYRYPDNLTDAIQVCDWLDKTERVLKRLAWENRAKKNHDEVKQLLDSSNRISFISRSLRENSQDFVFYTETREYRHTKDEYLVVKPVSPPKYLIKEILECDILILLSATIVPSDLWDLGYFEFDFLDVESPIPKEQRQILYQPASSPFKYDTPPLSVANYIQKILDKHPGVNSIVHVSYGWSKKLAEFFPGALFNSSEDKDEILKRFKEVGGVWFAAGCSEGIDLPDDQCRLIVIPIIFKPNPSDPVYKKRITQTNGYLKEELHTIKTVVQQAGRGCRHQNDWSITVVGDSAFPRIINKTRKYLPRSFLESIKWSA